MLSQGCEKLDTFLKTARHASDSSSDSNGTTEEDEERTGTHQPINGRDQVCDSVTREDAGLDSDSEDQAEYDLVTPDNMAPALVVEGETVYTQVFLNLQVSSFDQYTFPRPSLLDHPISWKANPSKLGDRHSSAWIENCDSIHVYQPQGSSKQRNPSLSSQSCAINKRGAGKTEVLSPLH